MALTDITRSAIFDTIDEHDRIRQYKSLTDYGFGAATKEYLQYDSNDPAIGGDRFHRYSSGDQASRPLPLCPEGFVGVVV